MNGSNSSGFVWLDIKDLNLTKKIPSLFLCRIVISCLVKRDRMCLSVPNDTIDYWASSSGFAHLTEKPDELAQSSILLLGRLRHILSRLTRQEMTIRRKKSDGLFLLVIPLLGGLRCLSCSRLQFAHSDQMVARYFLANIWKSYLGLCIKPQLVILRNWVPSLRLDCGLECCD